jgi:hypothetical protein
MYKHQHCSDLHIVVKKVQYRSREYTKLRVYYTDRNENLYWSDPQTIKVMREDYKKWDLIPCLDFARR